MIELKHIPEPLVVSILMLGFAGSVAAFDSVVSARTGDLESEYPAVRIQAARALGELRDRGATEALVRVLGDPDKDVRRAAARALGQIRDSRAVNGLEAALRDPHAGVRAEAASALGEIGDATAVSSLLRALDDPAWSVRDQAGWALQEIGDASMIAPLVASLNKDSTDADQVLWILKTADRKLTIKQLATLTNSDRWLARYRGLRALNKLNDPAAFGYFVDALRDSEAKVRRLAIDTLSARGDRRAREPLEALAATEEIAELKQAAVQAAIELSRHKDLDASWSFDDRSTSVAKDDSGRGNDGEIRGATPVKGKLGYALHFGPRKYIAFGQPKGLPISNRPFTVMAWVKTTEPHGVVVARGGAFCGYSLYVMDGAAKFGIHRTEEGESFIAAANEQIKDSWTHLAGTVKSDSIELYVNGRLVATTNTPGYIPGNCGQGMEIGFDAGNSPAEICDPFQGIIDEVKIFRAALSAEEIKEQAEIGE